MRLLQLVVTRKLVSFKKMGEGHPNHVGCTSSGRPERFNIRKLSTRCAVLVQAMILLHEYFECIPILIKLSRNAMPGKRLEVLPHLHLQRPLKFMTIRMKNQGMMETQGRNRIVMMSLKMVWTACCIAVVSRVGIRIWMRRRMKETRKRTPKQQLNQNSKSWQLGNARAWSYGCHGDRIPVEVVWRTGGARIRKANIKMRRNQKRTRKTCWLHTRFAYIYPN